MFGKQIRLLAVLFACTIGSPSLRAADPIPIGYSISVDFAPAPGAPDDYIVRTVISDAITQEVISTPTIRTKKGEPGKVISEMKSLAFTLDILVDKSGKSGSYVLTASKSGKVLSILKGSISIK